MESELRLKAYSDLVDQRLEQLLPPESLPPTPLHAAMRYSCLAPGKRLRPALCMASAESVGSERVLALDAACAIEMIHCFSLIHDDLPAIDDDDLRRGCPSCHKAYGEAIAILAGDALFALAFETVSMIQTPAETALAVLRELSVATGTCGLVGGEALDILSEGTAPDLFTLQKIHSGKTGSLISASCVIGGLVGGADSQALHHLRTYGQAVGLAFQIADDILNETSTPEQLGKAVGSDRERSKLTYPAIMGLDSARARARQMADDAKSSLDGLAGDKSMLIELANYSVERLR